MNWTKRNFISNCEECFPAAVSQTNNELEPRIIVSGFDDQSINSYIYKLEKVSQNFGPNQPIVVEIDSFGGSVYGLLRLIEAFNSVDNPVLTYCRSKAMSAGLILFTVIATPGNRIATPSARFMLHELQAGGGGGDIKDLQVHHDESLYLNNYVMGMFAKSIGLDQRSDVKSLIRNSVDGNELYLSADEAKTLNIVDEVSYVRMSPRTEYCIEVNPNSRKEMEEQMEKEHKEEMAKTKEALEQLKDVAPPKKKGKKK